MCGSECSGVVICEHFETAANKSKARDIVVEMLGTYSLPLMAIHCPGQKYDG
jgi:hypothetical protein